MKFKLSLVLLLIINICTSQNYYAVKYKAYSIKDNNKDVKSEIEIMFLDNLVYNFKSNSSICYLESATSLNDNGIKAINSGDENIYVNYSTKNVSFSLVKPEYFTYKKVKFIKTKASNQIVLGLKTTKYISTDGNLIIYTAKIPWYIQPGIVNYNQFNEGVVKFENSKLKFGLELIEYKLNKIDSQFTQAYKSLNTKKITSKVEILCPFFKLH